VNKAFRIYAAGVLGAGVVFLLVALGLNLIVNPWRMLTFPPLVKGLEPYRDTSGALRTAKAGLVCSHTDCEVVFAGSSRVNIGFNPEHPVLGGRPTLNLAFSGGLILETVPMVRYALAREKNLKLVILGIDPGDLCNDRDMRRVTDFYSSPLADDGFSLDRELRYRVGMPVLKASLSTLGRAWRGERSGDTPLGQSLLPKIPQDVRSYVKGQRKEFIYESAEAWSLQPIESRLGKVEVLRTLLSDLRRAGIRVLVVFPPLHALRLIHPVEDFPGGVAWERDRRILTRICGEVNALALPGAPRAEFWDFATFAPPMDDPLPALNATDKRLPRWFDLVHFSAAVGDEMLQRMLGPTPGSGAFGVNVLDVGIEAHLTALREAHRNYCTEHPADVAWMRSILGSAP
jgi:hypothetical protein